jgi:hypothetical protein
LGYTVRDIAYDYSVNSKQVNRFLDGKLPADESGHTADSRVLKVCGGVGSLMRVFGQQLPVLKKRAQRRIFSGRKRKEPSLR